LHRSKTALYSITSSARASNVTRRIGFLTASVLGIHASSALATK
jgi:hypothetical protein